MNVQLLFKSLATVLLAFFVPIVPLMVAVGVGICVDTMFRAWVEYKKGNFNSSDLKSGLVPKLILYNAVIITIYIIDICIFSEFSVLFHSMPLIITKITALTLASIEIFSLFETFEEYFKINIITTLKRVINIFNETKKDLE